ncbi:1316_t:CDS:1, partial [Gigaspora margarita]
FIASKTHKLQLANEENNDSESSRTVAKSQPIVANLFITKKR